MPGLIDAHCHVLGSSTNYKAVIFLAVVGWLIPVLFELAAHTSVLASIVYLNNMTVVFWLVPYATDLHCRHRFPMALRSSAWSARACGGSGVGRARRRDGDRSALIRGSHVGQHGASVAAAHRDRLTGVHRRRTGEPPHDAAVCDVGRAHLRRDGEAGQPIDQYRRLNTDRVVSVSRYSRHTSMLSGSSSFCSAAAMWADE